MEVDARPFEDLDEQERVRFIAGLLDKGTPNTAWIAGEHPALLRAVWEGREEVEGPDGLPVSPVLHLAIHGLVENQLATGDPPVVCEVADRLMVKHWDRHQAVHLFCVANIDELVQMLHDDSGFDPERFTRRVLQLLAESPRPEPAVAQARPR